MKRVPLDQSVFFRYERKKAMRKAVAEMGNALGTYFFDDDSLEYLELKELQQKVKDFQFKAGME